MGVELITKVITEFQARLKGLSDLKKLQMVQTKVAQTARALRVRHSEISRVMKATGLSANQSARAINQLGFTFDKSGRAVDALGKRMKLTNKIMAGMRKTTRRFNMGFLSLMFAAMALNRVVGTFLRSAIGAYAKATGESNNFRKETNKLVASWEFFKFSLIDALAQSAVFALLVGWLTAMINKLNALSPFWKTFIIIGIGALFLVSALLMVVGQIGLAHGGMLVLKDMWIASTALMSASTVGLAGKLYGLYAAIFPFIVGILAAVGAFFFLIGFLGGFDKKFDETVANWQRGGGIMVKTIGFIIRVLHLGGAFIRTGFLNLVDTLILAFQGILNGVIWLMNKVIGWMNEIPGVSIPIIPTVDFGALDRIISRTNALMEVTPTLSDLFTGGPEPIGAAPAASTGQTNIDQINFNIEGQGIDIGALTDEVMGRLDETINRGLGPTNT